MNFKKKSFLSVIIFLTLIVINKSIVAQTNYKKLVWADEFNVPGLPDSVKWGYDEGNGCPQNCGWGNNELEFYTEKRLENARVENGKLIIEARKENYNGFNYTSARLFTKNKGNWKYGRIEARVKIPAGKGLWPAVWMLPTKWEYGGWPHSGEIDIMENVGYLPDSAFGTIHTGAYNGSLGTQKTKGVKRKDLSAKFHVYAIEWSAAMISFFIDGDKYHEFKNENAGFEKWPFDKEFHLLLNLAVGGNWGGKFGVDDKVFPQKIEVDYVRVYQ